MRIRTYISGKTFYIIRWTVRLLAAERDDGVCKSPVCALCNLFDRPEGGSTAATGGKRGVDSAPFEVCVSRDSRSWSIA